MKYFVDVDFVEVSRKPITWLPTIGNWNKPVSKMKLEGMRLTNQEGVSFYMYLRDFSKDGYMRQFLNFLHEPIDEVVEQDPEIEWLKVQK